MWIQIGLAFAAALLYTLLRTWMTWAWDRLKTGEKVVPLVSDKFPMPKEK